MHDWREAWADFYVIVGSCAGALTGLQFVVMTLIAQGERRSGASIAAFGTPNVVHFCAAVLMSAILSVPWASAATAGLAVAVSGVAGTLYSVVVIRRAHRQREYQPVFEDWLWHTMLPLLTYASLLVAGATLASRPAGAMLTIGAATLLLVFIGIHNAWDTVTYLTTVPAVTPARSATATGSPRAGAAGDAPDRAGATSPTVQGPEVSTAGPGIGAGKPPAPVSGTEASMG